MINKVLIAEDHQTVNISVQKTLEEFGVQQTDYALYCDEALRKIRNAKESNHSYDMLITDLYFEPDDNVQEIADGIGLITAARYIQPDLRILVFSAEGRPHIIEALFSRNEIDAYVRKARNDSKELRLAFQAISENQRYYPRHIRQAVDRKNSHNFTDYDITIISLLARGMRQKDIPAYLMQNDIKPSGISSIEKRLNHIREMLDFTKNEQLVAFCKDMGII